VSPAAPHGTAYPPPVAIDHEVEERLCRAAESVALRAYAPYSGFRVGAALLSEGERIHAGANVENGSYSAGLCAERSALAAAVADGASGFSAIAIALPDADPDATANGLVPCGICRQWLAELAPGIEVVVCGRGLRYTIDELLPVPFVLQRRGDTRSGQRQERSDRT
jgi:cytidine deaminase